MPEPRSQSWMQGPRMAAPARPVYIGLFSYICQAYLLLNKAPRPVGIVPLRASEEEKAVRRRAARQCECAGACQEHRGRCPWRYLMKRGKLKVRFFVVRIGSRMILTCNRCEAARQRCRRSWRHRDVDGQSRLWAL